MEGLLLALMVVVYMAKGIEAKILFLFLQDALLMASHHLMNLLDVHIGLATRSVLLAGHVAPMHGPLRALRYVLDEAAWNELLTNGTDGV